MVGYVRQAPRWGYSASTSLGPKHFWLTRVLTYPKQTVPNLVGFPDVLNTMLSYLQRMLSEI